MVTYLTVWGTARLFSKCQLTFIFILFHIKNKSSQSIEKSALKVMMYKNMIVTSILRLPGA